MAGRRSSRPKSTRWVILIILAIVVQIGAILGYIVALRSGLSHTVEGPGKIQRPTEYLVLIDTSQMKTTVDGQTVNGLPDNYDQSRPKDFFAIYPSRYCSGKKDDGGYTIDHCSAYGKQFFNQEESWKTDGADLVLHGTIVKTAQKGIFFLLMGTIGLLCIVVIAGVFAFCSMRCGVIGTALSVLASVLSLSLATVAQVLVSHLVKRVKAMEDEHLEHPEIIPGVYCLRMIWIAASLSTTASVLWVVITCFRNRAKSAAERRQTATSFGHLVRRTTNKMMGTKGPSHSSYQHLGQSADGIPLESRNASRADLEEGAPTHPSYAHPSPSIPGGIGKRDAESHPAYEPLRHREPQ